MNTGDTRVLVHAPQDFVKVDLAQKETHQLHLSEGSETKELHLDGGSEPTDVVVDFSVQQGAHLQVQLFITAQAASHTITLTGSIAGTLNLILIQELSDNSSLTLRRELHITGEAYVHDLLLGGEYTDVLSILHLEVPGATGKQTATLFGSKKRYTLNQQSFHHAPETESDILTRGVLQDHAKAGLKGLIGIAPRCDAAAGYQNMSVLLLDPTAHAHAIPELAIETGTVSCSHGATIGRLDEEQLFYLQSRGMSTIQAKHLLVKGFLRQSMQNIPEDIVESLIEKIDARLVL